jgi:hypothetical protein
MHNIKIQTAVLSLNNQIQDTPITFWDTKFAPSEILSKSLTIQRQTVKALMHEGIRQTYP